MYRFWLWLRQPENTLWAMPTLGALFATLIVVASALLPDYLWPQDISLPDIELSTIESLLDVLASSMLAVTTFSLSIMVSAFASAAGGATPRATQLVMADDNTRLAIASFISAFIYSVIAKTALGMGYYQQNGRFLLFIATILVLLYLIAILIRWVHTLSQLGRMNNTIHKIELQSESTLRAYRSNPYLGAGAREPDGEPVLWLTNKAMGYLTHINMSSINNLAEKGDFRLHIVVRPGKLLYPGDYLAKVYGYLPEDKDVQALRDGFVVQANRSYDQDPRYGMIVLGEVAERALSPAVNDPGTAIKVMNVFARLLIAVKGDEGSRIDPPYYRLSIVEFSEEDLLIQAFDPLLRDGASNVDIAQRAQKILAGLWRKALESRVREAAHWQAKRALRIHHDSDMLDEDKAYIEALYHKLFVLEEHEDLPQIWD
ncbi:DUF2254 domain-containing protein [Suttonella sp. R2A3]|uniref:DUF2254 domain-containing protein n=1 Tax=Suttonella sp. R2A3 TaxID=2908648 RepID=UPI001F4247EB|nr:DUF2254 domain-containing protein [Suttonella sp. R2A3]UJF23715.1 DUF2254 domain-containing protein [Suttonella sp. R2A3]